MFALLAAAAAGTRCVSSPVPVPVRAQWHVAPIVDTAAPTLPAAEALLEGDAVVVVEKCCSANECAELAHAASCAAAAHRKTRNEIDGLVRVPTIAAYDRAAATGTPCAEPLSPDAEALVETILARVMAFVDETLPEFVAAKFAAPSLSALHAEGKLVFSSREPSVNVYGEGGEFLAHKDHQALTALVPLTTGEVDFAGGGTAYWSQDSRGHRVEPPGLVLRPPAGTCLLFGGHTTHAGTPVERGERCVLVASFSRASAAGASERAEEAARSRDIYGDLL